ncbi:MAG TPA: DUF4384 domain-containing protein, partial [Candidatus Ozemobacteraceae bacterium]|nr:DUF4384 domain-containing protein [Candidatus Ozemobacteraceae bacterium]
MKRKPLFWFLFLFVEICACSLVAEVHVRSAGVTDVGAPGEVSVLSPFERQYLASWDRISGAFLAKTLRTDAGDLFAPGSNLVFSVRSGINGYLTILSIDERGNMVVLFPNELEPTAKITGGTERIIPAPTAKYAFKLGKGPAYDLVKVILSVEPNQVIDTLARSPLKPYERIDSPRQAVQTFQELLKRSNTLHAVSTIAVHTASATPDSFAVGLATLTTRIGTAFLIKGWTDPLHIRPNQPFRLLLHPNAPCRLIRIDSISSPGHEKQLMAASFDLTTGVCTYPPVESDLVLVADGDSEKETLRLLFDDNYSGKQATMTLVIPVLPQATAAADPQV